MENTNYGHVAPCADFGYIPERNIPKRTRYETEALEEKAMRLGVREEVLFALDYLTSKEPIGIDSEGDLIPF